MKYTVVGVRRDMSFSGNDGKNIAGAKIFCLSEDPRIEGHATDSFFIPSTSVAYASVAGICPDSDIEIYFNRYGKVDSIVPA